MWRNKEVHEDNYERPHDQINHILKRYNEYESAKNLFMQMSGKDGGNKVMGWNSPI